MDINRFELLGWYIQHSDAKINLSNSSVPNKIVGVFGDGISQVSLSNVDVEGAIAIWYCFSMSKLLYLLREKLTLPIRWATKFANSRFNSFIFDIWSPSWIAVIRAIPIKKIRKC